MSTEEKTTRIVLLALAARAANEIRMIESQKPMLNLFPFNLLHKARLRGARQIQNQIK